jgi:hypothetical protein
VHNRFCASLWQTCTELEVPIGNQKALASPPLLQGLFLFEDSSGMCIGSNQRPLIAVPSHRRQPPRILYCRYFRVFSSFSYFSCHTIADISDRLVTSSGNTHRMSAFESAAAMAHPLRSVPEVRYAIGNFSIAQSLCQLSVLQPRSSFRIKFKHRSINL